MNSAADTVIMPTEPSQNGDSHLEASIPPAEVDISDTTSSSKEQISEVVPKTTESTAKKSEGKAVKTNKKMKGEEQKLRSLLKSFEDMEDPETKLDALGRKYLQLASEQKTTQARKDELEKRLERVVRERDQLQSECNKASLAKHKLESLCRELQRHSKLVKEQSQLRSQEEEAKRKELSEKFQTTINDISEQMQDNYKANQQLKNENNDLAARLKVLAEQYEVREEHVEKVFKHKQLELQLAEAKMAQQHLQFDEDKRKTLAENQLLITRAQEYQKQCEILTKQEAEMKSQLVLYAERFEDFQKTLNKSNEVFSTFKKEMDKMTKTIKKLEKEKNAWKTKCEGSNRSLLQMVEDREKRKGEMAVLRVKNEKLEKLCRALHKGTKVTANDTEESKAQSSVATENDPNEKGQQEMEAAVEVIQCTTKEESLKEHETRDEGKRDSGETTISSVSNDLGQTVQDAITGKPTESKDSLTINETSKTFPADSPSGPNEVPNESLKFVEVPYESENLDKVPNESKSPVDVPNESENSGKVPNESKSPDEVPHESENLDEVLNEPKNLDEVPNKPESPDEVPNESEKPYEYKFPDDVPNESENSDEVPNESKSPDEVPNESESPDEVPSESEKPYEDPITSDKDAILDENVFTQNEAGTTKNGE